LLVTSTAKLWAGGPIGLAGQSKKQAIVSGEYHSGRLKKGGVTRRAAARIKRNEARSCSAKASIKFRNNKKTRSKRPPAVKPTFRFVAKEWYDARSSPKAGESVQESTTRRHEGAQRHTRRHGSPSRNRNRPDGLRALSAIQKIVGESIRKLVDAAAFASRHFHLWHPARLLCPQFPGRRSKWRVTSR